MIKLKILKFKSYVIKFREKVYPIFFFFLGGYEFFLFTTTYSRHAKFFLYSLYTEFSSVYKLYIANIFLVDFLCNLYKEILFFFLKRINTFFLIHLTLLGWFFILFNVFN